MLTRYKNAIITTTNFIHRTFQWHVNSTMIRPYKERMVYIIIASDLTLVLGTPMKSYWAIRQDGPFVLRPFDVWFSLTDFSPPPRTFHPQKKSVLLISPWANNILTSTVGGTAVYTFLQLIVCHYRNCASYSLDSRRFLRKKTIYVTKNAQVFMSKT